MKESHGCLVKTQSNDFDIATIIILWQLNFLIFLCSVLFFLSVLSCSTVDLCCKYLTNQAVLYWQACGKIKRHAQILLYTVMMSILWLDGRLRIIQGNNRNPLFKVIERGNLMLQLLRAGRIHHDIVNPLEVRKVFNDFIRRKNCI